MSDKADRLLENNYYRIALVGNDLTILPEELVNGLIRESVQPSGNSYIIPSLGLKANVVDHLTRNGWRHTLVEEVGYDPQANEEDVARGLFYNDAALNAAGEWCAWGKPYFSGYAVAEPGFTLTTDEGLDWITYEALANLYERIGFSGAVYAVAALIDEAFANWTENTTFTLRQVLWWYQKQAEYAALVEKVREYFCPTCNKMAVLSTTPICDACLRCAAYICTGDAKCECDNGQRTVVYPARQGWPEVIIHENCPLCYGMGYDPDSTRAYRYLEALGRIADVEEYAIKNEFMEPLYAVCVEVKPGTKKPTGRTAVVRYQMDGTVGLQDGWIVVASTLHESTALEKEALALMEVDGKPAFEEFANDTEKEERYGQITLFGGLG